MIAKPPPQEPELKPPRPRSPRALLVSGAAAVRSLRSGLVAGERMSVASDASAARGVWRMLAYVVAAAVFLLAVVGALYLL